MSVLTYTARVEALTQEHAISLAAARFNELYDDGYLLGVTITGADHDWRPTIIRCVLGIYEVTFQVTGNYIGPAAPPTEPEDVGPF